MNKPYLKKISAKELLYNKIHALFHPYAFQGVRKRKRYFEGWYYKIVDKKKENIYAIIPGVAFDNNGKGHSFIQILDGKTNSSKYYTFQVNSFSFQPKTLNVSIEENNFTLNSIKLSLPELKGNLYFKNMVLWPSYWYSPGIMGPFSFIPFLECYHAIISLNHHISGELTINEKKIIFDEGKGYIEKDWGRSFPEGYIWMQANHFTTDTASFVFSIANIPFVNTSFIGFISAFYLKDNTLIIFSTYNGSYLYNLQIDKEVVKIGIANKKYNLEVIAEIRGSGNLVAPRDGFMAEKIKEGLLCKIGVTLKERKNNTTIFNEISDIGGLEITGKIDKILKMKKVPSVLH